MQEVTALLQRASVMDPDAAVEAIAWKQVRKFRVSVTGLDSQDQQVHFDRLFKGFDKKTPWLDDGARRAEVFCHTDVREWMRAFAKKVETALDKASAKSNV